jgi:hypothetical protein
MVTFKCEADGCANQNVVYDFLGDYTEAMCGGCKQTLIATDLRPDPEIEISE